MKKLEFALDKRRQMKYNNAKLLETSAIGRDRHHISGVLKAYCRRLRWEKSRTLLTCSDNTGVGRYLYFRKFARRVLPYIVQTFAASGVGPLRQFLFCSEKMPCRASLFFGFDFRSFQKNGGNET